MYWTCIPAMLAASGFLLISLSVWTIKKGRVSKKVSMMSSNIFWFIPFYSFCLQLVFLSMRLFIFMIVCLFVCPFVGPHFLSNNLSVCLSVCLFVCSSVSPQFCLSVNLSVCLSVCLPFCLLLFALSFFCFFVN